MEGMFDWIQKILKISTNNTLKIVLDYNIFNQNQCGKFSSSFLFTIVQNSLKRSIKLDFPLQWITACNLVYHLHLYQIVEKPTEPGINLSNLYDLINYASPALCSTFYI